MSGCESIEIDGREYRGDKLYRNETVLRHLYLEKEMVMAEVAEELDCSRASVSLWLDRYEVEKPDEARRARMQYKGKPVPLTHNAYGYEAWRHRHRGDRWWVVVHRLAAVAWFGYEAVAGNVIHHKNGCKFDNREENLEPMSNSAHTTIHNA